MPTFDTPDPISVTAELGAGNIRIVAGDRTDTIVEVAPSDASKKSDVTAARQTRVEFAGGRLLVKAPKTWRQYSFLGGGESIDVQISLPAGSNVRAEAGMAALRGVGRLGECHFKTGVGEIQLDETGPLELKTGGGDITVDRVMGHAEVTTGSGGVQIGGIDGTAVIRNSNGDTWIGEITGDLRVNAANGDISIDRAHATVAAKTANGDICLGQVERAAVVAQTGCGHIEVGIREGVAAWLDLNTGFGKVHQSLEVAKNPEPGEKIVEVRARSGFGDITVRHAQPLASRPADDAQ